MQHTLSIANLEGILGEIEGSGKNLIYIAGASASGKSYIAQLVAEELQKRGKKVLTISSDNYYHDDTRLKSVLYGTFDHPDLIDYELLNANLDEYMTKGKFEMPNYSFKESKRSGSTTIEGKYDYVLVEGLYTITKLKDTYSPLKMYVTSPEEDLVIRRLLRDPARVGEPLYMVVNALNNVYPMWNIFGRTQFHEADVVVDNYYDILKKEGKLRYHEPRAGGDKVTLGKHLYNEYVISYVYNDSSDDHEGKLIIEEHYEKKGGIMRSVTIVRTRSTGYGTENTVEHISLALAKAGILTQIHNLLQVAGLTYESSFTSDAEHYEGSDGKRKTLEQRTGNGVYLIYER